MPFFKKFIAAFFCLLVFVAFFFTFIEGEKEKAKLYGDMEARAEILGESLREATLLLLKSESPEGLKKLTDKFSETKNLVGIALYDIKGNRLASSASLEIFLPSVRTVVERALASSALQHDVINLDANQDLITVLPIFDEKKPYGGLALLHDTTQIREAIQDHWRTSLFFFLLQVLLIFGAILLIAHYMLIRPLKKAADWVKNLRLNSDDVNWEDGPPKGLFGPLAREVKFMAESLAEARAAAEEEAKLRQASESQWTPDRLKEHVKGTLEGRQLFVVANREPYVHTFVGKEIRVIQPASGLVTGLEPILKACGGMWIGHGGGEADRETVDENNHVRVPPEDPLYTLRRVWMSKEEENGYYYGFSNEGLWPLCHIAHTRPVFRAEDWSQYQIINQRFADAILEEIKGKDEPYILIQDYHFALLPRLIKKRRPDARVGLFWHIPWPNPESFGICPWQREIINGMLGADLLGFHIQFHCNNFLETVDRALESRIDWAQFSVTRENHRTLVKPFPISVAINQIAEGQNPEEDIRRVKDGVIRELGLNVEFIGIGVDRIDYTKGILERFRAIERFLEKYPQFMGRFTFVELGAPSRTLIQTYHSLDAEIESEVNRINWKLKQKDWKPIILLKKHHQHKDVERFYQASDLCMVTSLHDGMNLVAKEYIANKLNRQGALILSRFAGAALEFRDALIVNPYDIDQMADAIYYALKMDSQEQRRRMTRMQEIVRENNIYRWAADLISSLSEIPIDGRTAKKVSSS